MKRDISLKQLSFPYKPKSFNQEQYVNSLNDYSKKMVFVIGPAGTGKTLFACLTAIQSLKKGNIQKIVLTRPVVSVEEEIGFLPGNIVKKMDPWTKPIFDIFLEHYTQSDIDKMINTNMIEIAPLAFMRGRTFKNCFIIADEMQNSSPNQMMMLTTRIGYNSKMVITGDLKQTDRLKNNGLYDFIKKHSNYINNNSNNSDTSCITVVELEKSDIERSVVVEKILDIYQYKKPIQRKKDKNMVDELKNVNVTNDKLVEINNELIITQSPIQNNSFSSINKINTTKIINTIELVKNNDIKINEDAALIPKKHLPRRTIYDQDFNWGS